MHGQRQLPLAAARRHRISVPLLLLFLAVAGAADGAVAPAPEGRVRFYQIADTPFDRYSRDPAPATAAWMRAHYFRMQTYSPWFDARLAWYPDAWAYKDSFAIKPAWPVFRTHPDWVLRDRAGRMLYIDWGCSGGRCPQFAADIGNPEFRRWWIERARALIRTGYRGIWVDDVNLAWRISDGEGRKIQPIDPRTGRTMALPAWRAYFADFMEELRTAIPTAEIAHNSIWYAGDPRDPFIRRQILAADYINLERGATDRGLQGGGGTWGFDTFLGFIDEVHRLNRAVILMEYGDTPVEREFGLAAWLLVNEGRDLLSSDQLAWTAPDRWWPGYGLDLGRAKGHRTAWQGVLRRDFACGVALLNPPEQRTRDLVLDRTYRTLEGREVRTLRLGARTASVLRLPCAKP